MGQDKKSPKSDQAFYLGQWVDKKTFRAFVYDNQGNEKLADSYAEFESLTTSGIWYASKPDVSEKIRKPKDVALSDSK